MDNYTLSLSIDPMTSSQLVSLQGKTVSEVYIIMNDNQLDIVQVRAPLSMLTMKLQLSMPYFVVWSAPTSVRTGHAQPSSLFVLHISLSLLLQFATSCFALCSVMC